jgi:rhodanese-related sulfurtransferase
VRPRDALAFLQAHQDTQLLDVRTDAEFGGGRLPGAIHIPIKDLELQLTRLDKDRPVMVYCAGGYRSRKAVEKLKAAGFINIRNLHRGYHSWRLAGLAVEIRELV